MSATGCCSKEIQEKWRTAYDSHRTFLLAADAGNFRAAAQLARQAGGDRLHFDVMDGSFVPVISFGDHVLTYLKDSGLPLDVHLMAVRPEDKVEAFAQAGFPS